MQLMSGHDESNRTNRRGLIICDAAPQPRFLIQRCEERQAGHSHVRKLVHHISEGALVEVARPDIIVLVEAGKRRPVPASNAQSTIGEDPLGVGNVTDHLLHRPLAGRIAKIPVALASPRK